MTGWKGWGGGVEKFFFNGKLQDSLCNVYIRGEKSTDAHLKLGMVAISGSFQLPFFLFSFFLNLETYCFFFLNFFSMWTILKVC